MVETVTGECRLASGAQTEMVVLLSGGIDSAACAHLLKKAGYGVRGLFIDYSQAAADLERRSAHSLAKHFSLPLNEVALRAGSTFGTGELVGRNGFFVFCALFVARPSHGGIVLGIHAGTPYFDCSRAFFDAADRMIAEHTDGRVRLLAPLLTWSKTDVLDYCISESLPLFLTYSCEAGTEPPCGRCASCRDRMALAC